MIELPLNNLQRDKTFLLDGDDHGYLIELLYRSRIDFETNNSIIPSTLFSVAADEAMISAYNRLLHRHYKSGPDEFFFWQKKKMLNQAVKIVLKMENDDYNYPLLPIFISMKALDQSKIIFSLKKNSDSVFGFDLFVDQIDLSNDVNLLQSTSSGEKINYHLSFVTLN
jgi:hypothetical protein